MIGISALGGGVAVASSGGLAPPAVNPATVHRPTAVPDRIILTPTETPETSQSVTWRTSNEVTSPQVQWALSGPTVPSGWQTVAAHSNDEFDTALGYPVAHHSATMEGLDAGATYVYRVGDGETWSEWLEFTTASETAGGFSFLVQGDAQNDNKAYTSRTFRAAFEARPYARAVVHAGDLIDTETSDSEWGEWHEAAAFSNQYLNVIASTGNHEYYPGPELAKHWGAQFEYPLNGPADQPTLAETVYYVDYQGVRFISLDSTQAMRADSRASQTAWLEEVLAENPNDWTVVSFHHPIFSVTSGRNNQTIRDAWLPVFEQYDVDLVVQGHDHAYGRGNLIANEQNLPDGVSAEDAHTGPGYLVSVAGPKMYVPDPAETNNWITNDANLRKVGRDVQLFQTVDVTDDGRMHVEARTVDGAVFDAFTITQHEDGTKLVTEDTMWAGGPGSSREGVEPPALPEQPGNGDGEPGDGEPGDGEPGEGEPGDGEPGDGVPGDGEPGNDSPTIELGDTSVAPGDSLAVKATGFTPGERVSIELHSDPIVLALRTADDHGAVAATVTIPRDVTAGEHRIVLRGLESGITVSQDLIVTKSAVPTSGTLSNTGDESLGVVLALGGTLLAAAGGVFLIRTLRSNRKAA
ncbi:hypothetical protein GX865_06010 [Candidatus Saccharibacteria bacterium]|nr:hypothetical protein [Candidatus Saccharibacteria bacterium]